MERSERWVVLKQYILCALIEDSVFSSQRFTSTCTSRFRGCQGATMLYNRDGVHGDAPQTQRTGGSHSRCTPISLILLRKR